MELVNLLFSGAFSVVVRATDKETGAAVAVKIIDMNTQKALYKEDDERQVDLMIKDEILIMQVSRTWFLRTVN